MSGWAGFSEEELRKMQQKDSALPTAASRGRKPPAASRNRQQMQRERALQLAAQRSAGAGPPGLPPEQQLAQPPPNEERLPASRPGPPAVRLEEKQEPAAEEQTPVVKELEKQEVELREKTRLEQLQQEQKVIEERNKRKKALLTKTIAEKSKQTQAEAVKLKRIQKELQTLDDMVSNDIGILREKIEQASWDYSAARKRYEKAEAEYVAAKMDLHRKTEVKEQLTEHLCAIIQQNELRKAHKLEELMEQLQLQEERAEPGEVQANGDQGKGSVESREGTVQSTQNCRAPAEPPVEEETGGRDQREATGTLTAEQDCEGVENCVQGGTSAS
ncbi:unnamed protein product [Menidia menidia]|uniref:RAB6-interacting golgin n=1 Tax=Menidia menidia TaxID=238744 RepID=A0A8S4ADD3_9TELE|nr:unnamed protein product [Menidia menidia]